MFVYLNRKASIATQFGYANKAELLKVTNEELKDFPEPRPSLLVTRNPFKCLRDTSQEVHYDKKTNKIIVCKNLIKSELDLKSALAREKYWIKATRNKDLTNDEEAIQVIQSCKAEMDLYRDLDSALREEATRLCSKIQSKLKITNKTNRNVDTWHFYTRQLVEDNWYAYSLTDNNR